MRELEEALSRQAQEHARTTAALTAEQERFVQAFHGSPDSINLNRMSDGLYLAINQGFTRLMGYTEADVLGRTSLELDIWAEPEDRARLVDGLRARGKVDGLRARFRRKSGDVGEGQMWARILEVEGEPVILSITRDVTELVRTLEALRRSEETLSMFIEHAGDAMVFGTPDGCVSHANACALELLGRAPEALIGVHISELFAPDDLSNEPLRWDLVDSGQTVVRECRLARPDGTQLLVEMATRRMPDGSLQSILRDASTRRREEQERAEMIRRIDRAARVEAVARLAGGVAHDFANLLTPILMEASLIRQDPTLPAHLHAEVELIQHAAQRARELTGQVVSLGRVEPQTRKLLEPGPVVRDMGRLLQRLLGEDIEVHVEIEPDLPHVLANPADLQQIILNLATNARDAMPRGGRLELQLFRNHSDRALDSVVGETLCLVVSDNGTGMDEQTSQRIFEPYFTTKASGKGTGLGLATVRSIVVRMGGRVLVRSTPGMGTTFRVEVPGLPAEPRLESPLVINDPMPPSTEARILLVEDDSMVRRVASRVLEKAGYQVLQAADASAALTKLADAPKAPHLLLTDVVLPGMDGKQLADEVRMQEPGIRVLFASGHTADVFERHGLSGASLLQKPYTVEDLLARVRTALAH